MIRISIGENFLNWRKLNLNYYDQILMFTSCCNNPYWWWVNRYFTLNKNVMWNVSSNSIIICNNQLQKYLRNIWANHFWSGEHWQHFVGLLITNMFWKDKVFSVRLHYWLQTLVPGTEYIMQVTYCLTNTELWHTWTIVSDYKTDYGQFLTETGTAEVFRKHSWHKYRFFLLKCTG